MTDTFTRAYIDCALWSSSIEEDYANAWNLKHGEDFAPDTSMQSFGFTIDDIAPVALAQIEEDCAAFQIANASDLEAVDLMQAGHDFWLTRNRHGAGFWDGDWPEPAATRLTESSYAFGEIDLYIGDDERIYS